MIKDWEAKSISIFFVCNKFKSLLINLSSKSIHIYNYLLSHKEKLEGRSITGNTQWFEFGRSQGIKNIHNKKIAIGTTMPFDGLKTYLLDENTYVYSGLYATADNIDKLYDALNEPELIDYLIENGKPMRGDYVQISSTLLKNY